MITTTAAALVCPSCRGPLALKATATAPGLPQEVRSGSLECRGCHAHYPILAGVAILVPEARGYILDHVKGISRLVLEAEIPGPIRRDFRQALARLTSEHIEEDLESGRVVALYAMNHYLSAGAPGSPPWWAPLRGSPSPCIERMILEHWDHGPMSQIEAWVGELARGNKGNLRAVDLGCGVGGLASRLARATRFSYLGLDSSFASVAVGRHLALGMPLRGGLRIPGDLLEGPLSREVPFPSPVASGGADLVVADLGTPPVRPGSFELAIALNAIDMLDEPRVLPELQYELLIKGGTAIQSCPYIWHERVARALKKAVPAEARGDSAKAVAWLYQDVGFKPLRSITHLPWLFFKHPRQLELYSVHLFQTLKAS